MNRKIAASVLLGLPVLAIAQPVNMKPGLWAFRASTGSTQEICYGKDDLGSLEAMLSVAARQGGTACRWSEIRQAGDTWTYKQACKAGDSGEFEMLVRQVFSGDTSRIELTAGGNLITGLGKWVGDCR